MGKKNRGRPTVMTPEVLAKLEEGFSWCYTDAEACLYAGISVDALYDYQVKHPDFTERKQTLRLTPNLAAKRVLSTGIDGNEGKARWWAENKMGDEFAPKKKIELKTEETPTSDATKKVVDQFETALRTAIASERGSDPKNT